MREQKSKNEYNQPIGFAVADWSPKTFPSKKLIVGRWCLLEKISNVKHFDDMYKFWGPTSNPETWTYLSLSPFLNRNSFQQYLIELENNMAEQHYAIIDKITKKTIGSFALVAIDQINGSLEVGYVIYSDELKKTRIATEAQFLLMKYIFEELGYRRYVWMCDSYNAASRRSASRLGFSFEGISRNMWVYKGRNRDTAWYSMTDYDWPRLKPRFEGWLNESNFYDGGFQKKKITEF